MRQQISNLSYLPPSHTGDTGATTYPQATPQPTRAHSARKSPAENQHRIVLGLSTLTTFCSNATNDKNACYHACACRRVCWRVFADRQRTSDGLRRSTPCASSVKHSVKSFGKLLRTPTNVLIVGVRLARQNLLITALAVSENYLAFALAETVVAVERTLFVLVGIR